MFSLKLGLQVLASVEKYDVALNKWNFFHDLKTRRSGLQLLADAGGTIFCLGGFDGSIRLASCERFSFEKQRWKKIADMATPRSNFAAAVFESRIIVVGGYREPSPLSSVEIYHIPTNRWTTLNISLSSPRSALAMAFLPGGVPMPANPLTEDEDDE